MQKSVIVAVALALASCGAPPPEQRAPLSRQRETTTRHVQLLHLDGYRPDLTQALLEAGSLPRLAELAARGRISYETTTVDKSETMKVVQSYLTSQLDTHVAGWWQFDREQFRFANYWLDPAEVLNYALGLEFPVSPTLQDFLAARGHNLVSSMSLARRGVPFANYGRAYVEGIAAVSAHTYHAQADATMSSFLDIHRRIAGTDEETPALSTLLLAAADEFSHAYGVTTPRTDAAHCFRRDDEDLDATLFRLLDQDLDASYFTRVVIGRGSLAEEVCVELPLIEGRRAEPSYVLSMVVLDIELGYLIDAFKGVRFDTGESLFDRTLFIVFGDHGMVDTTHGMVDTGGGESFITYLNRKLSLATGETTSLTPGVELGIDYEHLPARLRSPESHAEWQSEDVRRETEEADVWARAFYQELRSVLRDEVHENYWWLFFLRSVLVDPKLDEALGPVAEQALSTFRNLYLRSRPEYLRAESQANRDFYDRTVRLVYGGGARNNAELFLPVCDADTCSWSQRPTYEDIVDYRNGAFMDALMTSPAVDLVFIRKNNELFANRNVPVESEIEVRNRAGEWATITVHRDERTGELLFHYRTGESSSADPLGYEAWGRDAGSYGTYNEWNDRTIDHSYVNVVGGIGAYLYSSNPAIGDVLVMHATDWNFGENRGGHGGVHAGEKRTMMLVSGPGVGRGELVARSRFRSTPDGQVVADDSGTHIPTLLDIVPTTLTFLGYNPTEFNDFAEHEFEEHLDGWIRSQHEDILAHLQTMSSVDKVKDGAGVSDLSLEPLMPRISRLLQFVGTAREQTLNRVEPRPILGNELVLDSSAPALP
jgi:hypothetical protein